MASKKLKILGCGTSTGVPIPGCECSVCRSINPRNKRDRTSAIIELADKRNILIDASPDLRHQALKWGVTRIHAVLFTHAHADHILGIDDLRGFNFVIRDSIPCYGTGDTLSQIRQMFAYIFDRTGSYEGGPLPQITLIQIDSLTPFEVCGIEVEPFLLYHGKMEVTGFKIGRLAYATDCKTMAEPTKSLLHGIDCLILDGLRFEPHKTHLTIPEAISLSQKLGAKQTYLTHMTHSVDYENVSRELPAGIALAYDGLEIEFD